jgi:hypothetical protein
MRWRLAEESGDEETGEVVLLLLDLEGEDVAAVFVVVACFLDGGVGVLVELGGVVGMLVRSVRCCRAGLLGSTVSTC